MYQYSTGNHLEHDIWMIDSGVSCHRTHIGSGSMNMKSTMEEMYTWEMIHQPVSLGVVESC